MNKLHPFRIVRAWRPASGCAIPGRNTTPGPWFRRGPAGFLAFVLLGTALLLTLLGCPPVAGPVSADETPTTGDIDGHARYAGLGDSSGILVSAESVDTRGRTLLVQEAIAGRSVSAARSIAGQATTDENGAYSLTGLAPGAYTVYASSQNSLEKAVTTGVTVVAGKSVTAADLNLTPTGSIAGKATLNGATSGNLGIFVFIAGTSYSATTDNSGAFTISSVPATTGYTLLATKDGYNSATKSVDVSAGSTVDAGTLNLTTFVPPATTGAVAGTMRLNNATSGNTGIFVCLSGTSYYTMTTDTSGAFTITAVAPGTYTLVASMMGYTSATVNSVVVTAGATKNVGTYSLSSTTGGVSGYARLGYSSVGNTGISVFLAGTSYSTTTNDSGAFALTGVDPGSYTLMATKDGYLPAMISGITVTAGATYAVSTINLAPQMAVETLAGTPGLVGNADGTGSAARFYSPRGIATDGYSLYVADYYNYTIRRVVISTGVVTTLAGTAGSWGSTDGTGAAARFDYPAGVACDGSNLYVADSGNHTIRKVVISTGVVTTLAGAAGSSGAVDGIGAAAKFYAPLGIAYYNGYLYVADTGNYTIRQIAVSSANVITLAGSAGYSGSTDGTGSAARFSSLSGVASDGTNVYVADRYNHTIRKVVISTGVVTTVAGTAGSPGAADGIGAAAKFYGPLGIAYYSGYLCVTDSGSTIRRIIASTGAVTTLAGLAGAYGSFDGMGNDARFNAPWGITASGSTLYLADSGNHTVRRIR